jgi:transcriptional regulator with XRE-family HTH domain
MSAPAPEARSDAAIQLGMRLREARQSAKLSLRELARRVDVSASLVSQVELGRTTPSVGTLYALVSELGLSLDAVMQDGAPSTTLSQVPSLRVVETAAVNGVGEPWSSEGLMTPAGPSTGVQCAVSCRFLVPGHWLCVDLAGLSCSCLVLVFAPWNLNGYLGTDPSSDSSCHQPSHANEARIP